jgi:hypothetical protein
MAIKTAINDNSLIDTLGSKLDLAGGKILQIVRATDSTAHSTTSTSLVDVTGMSVTITPQKSDSAIILVGTARVEILSTSDDVRGIVGLTDNSNNGISGADGTTFGSTGLTGSGTRVSLSHLTLVGRNTPATVDATTYKMRFRVIATGTIFVRGDAQPTQMYAIEVSA